MKTENLGVITSIKAAVDLPKHRLVQVDGTLNPAGGYPLGASIAETSSGEEAPICVSGIALVETAGNFSAGRNAGMHADGKVGGYSGNGVPLISLDAPTGAGELVRILLR